MTRLGQAQLDSADSGKESDHRQSLSGCLLVVGCHHVWPLHRTSPSAKLPIEV